MPSIPSQPTQRLELTLLKSDVYAARAFLGITTFMGIAIVAASIFMSLSAFQALPQGLNIVTASFENQVLVGMWVGVLAAGCGVALGCFIIWAGAVGSTPRRTYQTIPVDAHHLNN